MPVRQAELSTTRDKRKLTRGQVRCDLEDQRGGICSNCRRRRQICRRRRKSYPSKNNNDHPPELCSPRSSLNAPVLDTSANDEDALVTPQSPSQAMQNGPSTIVATRDPQANVGDLSFMGPLATQHEQDVPRLRGAVHARYCREVLSMTDAEGLPSDAKIQASADAYFQHLYHRAPVVDPEDLQGDRLPGLICHALCLIGTLLRHPGIHSPLEESDEYYCKVKALLFFNDRSDHRTVLKALCLLAFRNVTPPKMLSLECSWQWLGMATRLAYQMGLHRESTYTKLTNPGNACRIMWSLYVEDKLQSACYGRPPVIRAPEFDTRPVEIADFSRQNIQAELFIEYMKLNIILGKIVDCNSQGAEAKHEEAINILQSLQQWINDLPHQLRLYHGTNRCTFRRDVYEVHVNYFVCIIVFLRLFGHSCPQSSSSSASLAASSCIARLYEEIHLRDEVNYLMPINNWFLMVGCAPLIHRNAANPGRDKVCTEELHTLMTILRYMHLKWPPANTLLGIIESLSTVNSKEPIVLDPSGDVPRDVPGIDEDESWSRQPYSGLLKALFPFPSTLSPRIDLVERIDDEYCDMPVLEHMAGLGNDDLNWIFNQYELDFLEAPFD